MKEMRINQMFIRIGNNLINTNEIRNAYIYNFGDGEGTVHVIFKTDFKPLVFPTRKIAECETILDTLTEACLKKN